MSSVLMAETEKQIRKRRKHEYLHETLTRLTNAAYTRRRDKISNEKILNELQIDAEREGATSYQIMSAITNGFMQANYE